MDDLKRYTSVEVMDNMLYVCSNDNFVVRGPSSQRYNLLNSKVLNNSLPIAVWDLRRIIDWPLTDDKIVYDVKSVFGGEDGLENLARRYERHNLLELEKKFKAHARASKLAGVSFLKSVPQELKDELAKERAIFIKWLIEAVPLMSNEVPGNLDDYEARWPFIRALREIELNGIHIDEEELTLQLNGATGAQAAALRSAHGLCKGGYITTLYNPMGGKTGRVRHEGGFNALAIPRGDVRKIFNSRFENGVIASVDFNAIDYRCIVKSVGEEMQALYAGADDFHERTASFIFKTVDKDLRDAIKYVSYIYIYGGSDETLVEKTGWTLDNVKKALELLDNKIGPIKQFRDNLTIRAKALGYVEMPGGRRYYIDKEDSPGKIIGLYAQTFSSKIFEQAVVRVQGRLREALSKLIMVVHDEMVIDVHPDEISQLDEVKRLAESEGFAVKIKKGVNYGTLE